MDSDSPTSAPRGDTNLTNIGANTRIDQYAQGEHITQIKGFTAEQVRVLIADIRASYQRKPFDGRSPYVGLASFQEQDADRFFGREKLTQELVARIETARFLVIAGPSGSGKSSLARAGLMHTLRRGVQLCKGVQLNAPTNISTGTENWLYEILTPGRNPLTELARVVSSFTKSLNAGDEIVKRGRADETLLHRWADIALGDQKTRRAILLVDQFEEVFTQVTDESERAAFLNLLVYAATAENGRVTIVCCTRSDFIGNWVKYPNLNDLLRHGLYQIPPMQPDELVSAIARPAIQVGLPIDETLVKEILDDMRAAPGALPLMQFALQDLFEYEKNQGGVIALTRDDYKKRGGLHQALSRHADAEFAKLSADEQQIARSVFAGLIEPGRGNVDTRRTALLEEIVSADADAAQVKNVITKLADARLVTTDKKDADETITLAHERLLDAWKWLRDLIDENREAIALQNQINDDAKEWEQQGRDASYLYTGARLATAQEEVEKKKVVLSVVGRLFVEAGIAARDEAKRQETQRTRRLIMAVGAVAAIFAVLAVFAFSRQLEAEHQQRIARSRELAALARSEFDKHPDIAVLIAAEANKDPDAITFESEDALRESLGKYPLQFALRWKELGVQSTQFSHDGTRLVTASDDGKVQIWDAESSKEIAVLSGHVGPAMSAQFSHDDNRIVTVGCETLDEIGSCVLHSARIWDTANGKSLAVLNGHQAGVLDAQFSPNDKWILTTGCEKTDESFGCAVGTARLWDVETSVSTGIGKQIAVINGQNVVGTAQFSPLDWQHGVQIATIECVSSTPTQPNEVSSCYPHTARVWNLKEWGGTTEIQELAAVHVDDGWVIHMQFVSIDSSQSIQVVTTDTNGQVRVSDAVSGKEISALRGVEYDVVLAEISPDGTKIVTANVGNENTARIWNMADGGLIDRLEHTYEVTSIHFSPNGEKIVTASYHDQTARVWQISDLSNRLSIKQPLILNTQDYVTSALFSPDSNQIVTTGPNRGAQVWDANGSRLFEVVRAHASNVTSAEYSLDGRLIVTAGCDKADSGNICLDYSARVWDAASHEPLAVLSADDHKVLSAKFSPTSSPNDATVLTIGCVEFDNLSCISSTARIWKVMGLRNTESEKQFITLAGHQVWVKDAKFSADGTRILAVACEQVENEICVSGAARIWDTASGQLLVTISDHGPLNNAEFSPDGSRVITGGCERLERKACRVGSARIWDATGGKELVTLHGHTDWVRTAQYSPGAKRVVTASRDGTARVWDATSGKELFTLKSRGPFFASAQFSPDGKQIVAVSTTRSAQIVDSANGKVIAEFPTNGLDGIRFSSDSKRILATSGVWDATSGKLLSNLHWDASMIESSAFSPDGSKVLTASKDGMVRIYSMKVADLVTLAQKRIGRELECFEREQYLNEKNVCSTPTPEESPTP